MRCSTGRQRAAIVEHVTEKDTAVDDWVVVVGSEEIGHCVGIYEAAARVECRAGRGVAGANEHGVAAACIAATQVFHKTATKSTTVETWLNGDILQLAYPVTLDGDYSDGKQLATVVTHGIQVATVEITLDHRLLLIGH